MYILYDRSYSKQLLNAAHALPPQLLTYAIIFYLSTSSRQATRA